MSHCDFHRFSVFIDPVRKLASSNFEKALLLLQEGHLTDRRACKTVMTQWSKAFKNIPKLYTSVRSCRTSLSHALKSLRLQPGKTLTAPYTTVQEALAQVKKRKRDSMRFPIESKRVKAMCHNGQKTPICWQQFTLNLNLFVPHSILCGKK